MTDQWEAITDAAKMMGYRGQSGASRTANPNKTRPIAKQMTAFLGQTQPRKQRKSAGFQRTTAPLYVPVSGAKQGRAAQTRRKYHALRDQLQEREMT